MKAAALALLLLGGILTVGTLLFWGISGAHWGWTQTYVVEQKIDPVTDISFPEKTEKFVPGLEILAAGAIAGTFLELLGIVLLILHRKKNCQ